MSPWVFTALGIYICLFYVFKLLSIIFRSNTFIIRNTDIIERAIREFRRSIKLIDSFPKEESCIMIMFALAKLLNED